MGNVVKSYGVTQLFSETDTHFGGFLVVVVVLTSLSFQISMMVTL